MAEIRLAMCKGPGGIVEVFAIYDDATGVFSDITVVGVAAAKSKVKIAGITRASPSYNASKRSANVPNVSNYKVDLSNSMNNIVPDITIDS